ncbi:MAG: nuclear transport factor 2 family protein [Acidobacteriota bacterium]
MKKTTLMVLSIVFLATFYLNSSENINYGENIKKEILAVLEDSVKAWNKGSLEEYMECYHKSPELRFAGNGGVTYGWETTLKRYKKGYPNKEAMGFLTFSDVKITVISEDAALVFGKWKLKREKDEPNGVYTLLFRKVKAGWRIVHDHSSSSK